MPIPEDYVDIVNNLREATAQNRVVWEEESGGAAIRFPTFRFCIWSGFDEESEGEFVAVAIRDESGKIIDSWHIDQGGEGFGLLRDLCKSALRRARRIDEKLEVLRNKLKEGGEVGRGEKVQHEMRY